VHGLIVSELRSYVIANYGADTWHRITEGGGVSTEITGPNLERIYPDPLALALIDKVIKASGMPKETVLEDFGNFIAPALLHLFPDLIQRHWRTLDVIERTEERIHQVVRSRDPDAAPPYLTTRRVHDREVQIVYTSPRRLCWLAEGIARGLAAHYGETVEISQPECMARGGGRCLISVRLVN
jgi:predicted hydrocarbon binding protein